jgi:hypothetical protein
MYDPDYKPRATGDTYPTHRENFDVVMLKTGVSPTTAKPDDFRRVNVVAGSPFEARQAAEVAAAEAEGWATQDVKPPGSPSELEHQAGLRAHEAAMGPPTDKTKI